MTIYKTLPMFNEDTIYIQPGIYTPYIDMYVPHNKYIAMENDKWKKGEYFIVSKHRERIGDQEPYQYYAIKRLGPSKHFLVKSYETDRWNTIAQILRKAVKSAR